MIKFSLSELDHAFQAVSANRGCGGVDGVSLSEFNRNRKANLQALQFELERGSYHPLPLMKIMVAKKNGEPRKLCIPAIRDRVVQKALLIRLDPILEKEFEVCSFAYRKGRSIQQVVQRIKSLYDNGYRWAVNADIDAFFDLVDHSIMHEKVRRYICDPGLSQLIEKWISAEVWDGRKLSRLTRGIPQGSAISPILANLFLDELDEAMVANGWQYIRYADDFLILCKEREQAFEGLKFSKEVLASLLLELDDEEVSSFDKGFKYLGVYFVNSMIMKPFETRKQHRRVLYYPPPMDMVEYRKQQNG